MLVFSNYVKNDASTIYKSLPQRPACNLVSAEERALICGLLICSALLSYMSVIKSSPYSLSFYHPNNETKQLW